MPNRRSKTLGRVILFSACLLLLVAGSLSVMAQTSGSRRSAAGSSRVLPQIWLFANDDIQRKAKGLTPQDYRELFAAGAPWQNGLSHVQVFGITEYSARAAPPDELRELFAFLRAHNIALATTGEMDPVGSDGCGKNISSYTMNPQALRQMAERIRQLGGVLSYVEMDEPLFYARANVERTVNGTTYRGCHFPIPRIAAGVAQSVAALRSVFPDVQVGDAEPVIDFAAGNNFGLTTEQWLSDLEAWVPAFEAATGRPLAFLHADVSWIPTPNKTADWQRPLQIVADYFRSRRIPLGIFYNGIGSPPSDTAWVALALERANTIEKALHIVPEQAVIASWFENPVRLLPETQPGTLTYLLNEYVRSR